MKKYLAWIFGVAIALMLIAWLFVGRADRQAYRTARGAIEQRTELSQERIDMAVEMAIASVDLALAKTAELPSQEAAADLIKQDIEEIGNRLKAASEARGDLAIERLNQSIEQFNTTLQAVEEASNQAENPVVKTKLDRLYGILEGVKEQLVQAVLKMSE
jgi:hypothetical protein